MGEARWSKLGDILAQIELTERRRREEQEARNCDAAAKRERTRKTEARSDMSKWMQEVSRAINEARPPPPLSGWSCLDEWEGHKISDQQHRDKDLFAELQDWAWGERMRVYTSYDPQRAKDSRYLPAQRRHPTRRGIGLLTPPLPRYAKGRPSRAGEVGIPHIDLFRSERGGECAPWAYYRPGPARVALLTTRPKREFPDSPPLAHVPGRLPPLTT